ncbi:MAG: acyl-CoA dehydrogenase [Streptosporangiales bacterium]|nr:acyl-CoA dehydrogenase [Streptosporangiales bacterium]
MTADSGAWEMPEELVMLRRTVADFMEHEVRPAEDKLEFDAVELPADDLERLQRKARQAGLWCIASPEEYGGAGLDLLAQCVVTEEAVQCRMGAYIPACGAMGWDPPNVIFQGTKEQIERYGIPALEKGKKTFVAISEPSGGSDPGRSIKTRAVRKGDTWVLNGTKLWISGVSGSDWGVVFARTGSDTGRGGISSFIVPTDSPGFSYRPVPVIRAWSPYEVHLEDCTIPAENLLGGEGEGFAFAEKWLVNGRVPYAAGTIGIAQAALKIATDYAKIRNTFGGPLSDRQAVQWMLADSEIELRAARLLVYQAAWKALLGQNFKIDASIAKVYATETAGRVVDRCIQIMGGLGVAKEMPLERWYRELRIKRIGEGPSEVHRLVVARDLLKRKL